MTPMRRNLPTIVIILVALSGFYYLSFSDSRPSFPTNIQSLHETLHTRPSFVSRPKNVASTSTTIETTMPTDQFVYGFGIFDRIYLRKGTFYIVTSDPSRFPQRKSIIARPVDSGPDVDRDPTDKELQIIDLVEANQILGDQAVVLNGFTVVEYDTDQFMTHYYHWWGEIILGAWRVYAALMGSSIFTREPGTPLFASRFILPHVYGLEWRDRPGLNAGLMRVAFPSMSIENADVWDDYASLDTTFVFERAMIISRVAAHTHPFAGQWFKMISSTMTANVSDAFWEPVRQTAIQNTIGYVPQLNSKGQITSPPQVVSEMPFVTYISRQNGGRRLAETDHSELVSALKELEWSGLCQVYIAHMEKLTMAQQLEVMARSTVLVGVHGNGLTHQLFMPPSPRSTVIEIFAPGSYVHDYAILSRNVGHKHYGVWNDTLETHPRGQWHQGVHYTADFHGLSIPVHGPAIADLIRQRLSDPLEKLES